MFAQSEVLTVPGDLGPLKFKHIHEAELCWKQRKWSQKTTDHTMLKLGNTCVLQSIPAVEEQWVSITHRPGTSDHIATPSLAGNVWRRWKGKAIDVQGTQPGSQVFKRHKSRDQVKDRMLWYTLGQGELCLQMLQQQMS